VPPTSPGVVTARSLPSVVRRRSAPTGLDPDTRLRGNGAVPASETIGDDRVNRSRWSAPWMLASIAILVAVAAIALAVHYRGQVQHRAARSAQRAVQLSFPPPAPLHMGEKIYRVRAGQLAMKVTFTSAVDESQRRNRGQVQITAVVTGAPPGSHLRLDGGDCTTNKSLTWATGVADAAGTAYLRSRIWEVSASHGYYLDLEPWHVARRLPGLNGIWLGGLIQPFRAGFTPCL